MKQRICQSCGMPMVALKEFGTELNGDLNQDYCVYCYKEGNFTSALTMDEMITHCTEYMEEFNKDSETKVTKEQAIDQMKQFFPTLKRWKN